MNHPTKIQELNDFAKLLNSLSWQIIVPKVPSTYFKAFKDGIFIYIQYERLSGCFSFSTTNIGHKNYGTGHRITEGALDLENIEKSINFFKSYYQGEEKSKLVYKSLDDYFKRPINQILNPYIYKF